MLTWLLLLVTTSLPLVGPVIVACAATAWFLRDAAWPMVDRYWARLLGGLITCAVGWGLFLALCIRTNRPFGPVPHAALFWFVFFALPVDFLGTTFGALVALFHGSWRTCLAILTFGIVAWVLLFALWTGMAAGRGFVSRALRLEPQVYAGR